MKIYLFNKDYIGCMTIYQDLILDTSGASACSACSPGTSSSSIGQYFDIFHDVRHVVAPISFESLILFFETIKRYENLKALQR